jgi:hypothetical protein
MGSISVLRILQSQRNSNICRVTLGAIQRHVDCTMDRGGDHVHTEAQNGGSRGD